MTTIERKINLHRETGTHNDFKTFSAMLKRVASKKCMIAIRRHYEAVPLVHIDVPIWILASACDCANMDSVQ